MSAPRILLVDDERQLSRMLRTSLELSGRGFVVIDVPSGEEALLELGRAPVDLLVTDLRLPGMSGLELLERARQVNPDLRAIVITGHPSEEMRARAQSLGVVALLPKPIGTNLFLATVDRALQLAEPGTVAVDASARPHLEARLAELQHELGAQAAALVDPGGAVVAQSGDLSAVDLDQALGPLQAAFQAGLKVSHALGSLLPANLQFFDGEEHDLYLTNVGAYYGLVIAFSARQGAGKMGAVVHYGRRAADDLLALLSTLPETATPAEAEPEPFAFEVVEEGEAPDLSDAVRTVDQDEAARFWEEAVAQGLEVEPSGEDVLTYEEARRLGLISDEAEGETS